MKPTVKNPFATATYFGPEYFCDRKEETANLLENLENGVSTTVLSVRRIGKTGLLQHLLHKLPKSWKGIYMDILETENLNQLLDMMATSILKSVPEKSNLGNKFWNFVKSLRPVISFDGLTGAPQASFDLKPGSVESNLDSLLDFLEQQDLKILIVIDEFQQILNYPEKKTDAWLRSRMQQLKNVVFIFSGSNQHLMASLFSSPNKPFFRSIRFMKLNKLDKNEYIAFIIKMFKKYKKEISKTTAGEMIDWADCHTYYVQQLCNKVFANTNDIVSEELWKMQAFYLLKEQETVFFAYRKLISKGQWNLLKAIAGEGKVYHFTSSVFIKKYGLTSSSSVVRALKSIEENELVYSDFDENGDKYYSVYDVFFKRWIQ